MYRDDDGVQARHDAADRRVVTSEEGDRCSVTPARSCARRRLAQERPTEPRPETRIIDGIRVDVLNTREDVEHRARVPARRGGDRARARSISPGGWRTSGATSPASSSCATPAAPPTSPTSELCMLELTFMANEQFSDSQVAASFVHEGMHARLDRLSEKYGVTPFAAGARAPRADLPPRRARLRARRAGRRAGRAARRRVDARWPTRKSRRRSSGERPAAGSPKSIGRRLFRRGRPGSHSDG